MTRPETRTLNAFEKALWIAVALLLVAALIYTGLGAVEAVVERSRLPYTYVVE